MADYRIENIDLAATIWTATGVMPEVSPSDRGLAAFTFPETNDVCNAVIRYEGTGIMVNARRLLANRRTLYRMVKGGR